METSDHERSCKAAANEVESPWQESPPVPQAHHDIGHFRNQPREMTYVQGDVPGKDNRTGCCDRPFPAQVFTGVSAIRKDRKCFRHEHSSSGTFTRLSTSIDSARGVTEGRG